MTTDRRFKTVSKEPFPSLIWR